MPTSTACACTMRAWVRGPLILFLHGYPSFWYQWKDQMLEMSRDHLAVGLDMRGYNLSSKPTGLESYKMKALVEDVRQFVEKIVGKNKKFVLVAHDWGANVAWVFAMYHPEMLEKLIIINGAHPFLSERSYGRMPPSGMRVITFSCLTVTWLPERYQSTRTIPGRAAPAVRMPGSWTPKLRKATTPKKTASDGSMHGRSPVRPLRA
jgi:pimeloyl-ACP methyl ester carboxylesterase